MYLHVPAALAADGGEGGEPVRLDPCALAAEGALGVVGSWDGWVEPLWFPRSGPGVVLRVHVPRPAPGVGGLVHYKFRTRSGLWCRDPTSAQDADGNCVAIVREPVAVVIRRPGHVGHGTALAVCGSFSGWQPLDLGDSVHLSLGPGEHTFKLRIGEGADTTWETHPEFPTCMNALGVPNNVLRVADGPVAGLVNPDSRCFLNSAVQALAAVGTLRDHVRNLSAVATALSAPILTPFGEDAGCIVAALASAFTAVASRVGPVHCHPLHHFAMQHGWFTACVADDSVMVARHLLRHVAALSDDLSVSMSSTSTCTRCGVVTGPVTACTAPVFTLQCAATPGSAAPAAAATGHGYSDSDSWTDHQPPGPRLEEAAWGAGDAWAGGWGCPRPASDGDRDDGTVAWAFSRARDTAGGGLDTHAPNTCVVCGVQGAARVEVVCDGVSAPEALFLQLLPVVGAAGQTPLPMHRTFDEVVCLELGLGSVAAYTVRSVIGKTGGATAEGHFVTLVREDVGGEYCMDGGGGGSGGGSGGGAAAAAGSGGESWDDLDIANDPSRAKVCPHPGHQWWLLDDERCTRVRTGPAASAPPLWADPSLEGLVPCLLGLQLLR